jgi:hypothetical protein
VSSENVVTGAVVAGLTCLKRLVVSILTFTTAVMAVMVGMATGRPLHQLAMHLDFGIAEVELLGPHDEEVYMVRFTCGCVGVVAHGRMIRRAGGVAPVCAHVSAR